MRFITALALSTAILALFSAGVLTGRQWALDECKDRIDQLSEKAAATQQQLDAQYELEDRMVFYAETKYNLPTDKARRLVAGVLMAAHTYGVDPRLTLAQINAESTFNPKAVSYAGAVGLMQVMPFWLKDKQFRLATGIHSLEQLKSPANNLRAGAYIQAHYQSKCGGTVNGLRCYHGGFNAVKNPRMSTLHYVDHIMRKYHQI